MLLSRPWVRKVIETEQNSKEDMQGIDMFVEVDEVITDLLCMERGEKGLKVQVKSSFKKERDFHRFHRSDMFNLATGETIFVLNGQEERSLMMATLIGQMIAMLNLTDTVPEKMFLGLLVREYSDKEIVDAYKDWKLYLERNKWFRGWLDGSKI
jgi:hypothetical protein